MASAKARSAAVPVVVAASAMALLLLVANMASAAPSISSVPAERVAAAGGSDKSSLRPDFVDDDSKAQDERIVATYSSFLAHLDAKEGEQGLTKKQDALLYGASKFQCPCSNQFCDGRRWRICSCNVRVCSCSCHN